MQSSSYIYIYFYWYFFLFFNWKIRNFIKTTLNLLCYLFFLCCIIVISFVSSCHCFNITSFDMGDFPFLLCHLFILLRSCNYKSPWWQDSNAHCFLSVTLANTVEVRFARWWSSRPSHCLGTCGMLVAYSGTGICSQGFLQASLSL